MYVDSPSDSGKLRGHYADNIVNFHSKITIGNVTGVTCINGTHKQGQGFGECRV